MTLPPAAPGTRPGVDNACQGHTKACYLRDNVHCDHPLPHSQALPNFDVRLADIAAGVEIAAVRRLGDRDEARDAAQETVARLLSLVRDGRVADESELARIAWGIARHVIADMLRSRRRTSDDIHDVVCPRPGPLDALATDDDIRRVRTALAAIPEADRMLLARCFVDGERIGRIAAELGEPPDRLRKRKSRALQRLAAVLGVRPSGDGHEARPGAMEEA